MIKNCIKFALPLALLVVTNHGASGAIPDQYLDLAEWPSWAQNPIQVGHEGALTEAVRWEIIQGTLASHGQLRLDGATTLSEAEALVILTRSLGQANLGPDGTELSHARSVLAEYGIHSEHLERPVTRIQMARWLASIARKALQPVVVDDPVVSWQDASQLPEEDRDALWEVGTRGLMLGDLRTFRPDANLTRVEGALVGTRLALRAKNSLPTLEALRKVIMDAWQARTDQERALLMGESLEARRVASFYSSLAYNAPGGVADRQRAEFMTTNGYRSLESLEVEALVLADGVAQVRVTSVFTLRRPWDDLSFGTFSEQRQLYLTRFADRWVITSDRRFVLTSDQAR